jgi:repressor LexA
VHEEKGFTRVKTSENGGSFQDSPQNEGSQIPRAGGCARALAQARQRAGISQSELARRAGCERSYVSMLEMMRGLERALGMAEGELRREAMRLELRGAGLDVRPGEWGASALDAAWRSGELARLVAKMNGGLSAGSIGGNVDQTRGMLMRQVPLINNVAAGTPTEFTDLGYPARVADEYVAAPMVDDPDAFAARVVGDSMEPTYRAGDIVIFSPARVVQSGMDCFVRLEPDQETTFKRVRLVGSEGVQEGETHIRLEPLNPKYPVRVVEREMVAGMYAAVSVTRRV